MSYASEAWWNEQWTNGSSRLRRADSFWRATRCDRLGYAAIDLIVDRWATLRDEVAWAGATREEMEARFREDAPEEGSPPQEVMERAAKEVMHFAGRIDHPRFFAFVPSSPTWPTVLADMLATGFNVFQGTWLESAGPSQIELVVLDWFRDWLGLPESSGGVFTSGGSAANLDALVAARASHGHPSRPRALSLGSGALPRSRGQPASQDSGLRPCVPFRATISTDWTSTLCGRRYDRTGRPGATHCWSLRTAERPTRGWWIRFVI